MYPDRELIRLATRKTAVRRRIAVRRAQCAKAAARVARPVVLLDRAVAYWRRLPLLAKVAAVPLVLLAKRAIFPRRKILRSLLRWGLLAFNAVRIVSSGVKNRSGSPKFSSDHT